MNHPTGIKEKLTEIIVSHLGSTYHCTRVWEAWNVGTMGQDDFEPINESNTPSEIAEEVAVFIERESGVAELIKIIQKALDRQAFSIKEQNEIRGTLLNFEGVK